MNNQNQPAAETPDKAECCPRFNPAPWDNKTLEWNDKKFVTGKVKTIFNMPVNFGAVITKLMETVDQAGAQVPDNLCLSDHTSRSNMDLYLAVDKEIPGAANTTLSGKYYSKVNEGGFKDTGQWCQDFEKSVKEKGREVKKWYMWYTTCPKCAKKYGRNYVVIIGKIE